MDTQLEYVSCAVCGGRDAEVFIRGPGPLDFVRCRNDGLLYMNPRPAAGAVRKFHANFVRAQNLQVFGYRREILQREAAAIKRLKQGGKLLDIGCATGAFFENFQDSAWELYGIDSSPLGLEIARARYNAELVCGAFSETNYPSEFFDVVTVLDTLYYVPHPRTDLLEAYRILKPGGLLAVETPGCRYSLCRAKGPVSRVLDGTWMGGFTGSWHLFYFTPRSMNILLESAGFHVISVLPEQASLGRVGLERFLSEVHFSVAKLLFRATAGRVSIAAKELYLAVKSIHKTAGDSSPPASLLDGPA